MVSGTVLSPENDQAGGTLVTSREVTLVTFLFGNSGFNLGSL